MTSSLRRNLLLWRKGAAFVLVGDCCAVLGQRGQRDALPTLRAVRKLGQRDALPLLRAVRKDG